MVNHYLYYIRSKDYKYLYIGVTNNITRRKNTHFRNSHNEDLRNLIVTKGHDFFELVIIETSEDRGYIESLEIEHINKYLGSKTITLLNKSKGGSGGNGVKGVDHFNSRLLEEDILDIRYRYYNAITKGRDLATEYKVSYKTISKIVRGDRWPHVGGPISLATPREFKAATSRKLTDYEVEDLRRTYCYIVTSMGSMKMSELEEIYGIARQNIRKILTGKSYSHLPGPLLGIDYGD